MSAFPLDRPAYLGLDRDPAWIALVAEGLGRYGTHYAGSRRAPYCPDVFARAEAALATWTGAPAALTMSSASLAAATLADLLAARGYHRLCGPLAHAAWRRGGAEVFAGEPAWRARAEGLLAEGASVALVTDRLCALRAVEVDLAWVGDLPVGGGRLALVVDDSHALGALRGGRGSYADLRGRIPVITLGSLGKAFSVPGAAVAGAADWIAALEGTAGYGGASPMPPAYAYALAEGLRIRGDSQASIVGRRIGELESLVKEVEGFGIRGGHVSGHPVFRVDDAGQRDALSRAGIVLSTLAYPTADDAPVTRLVLRAGISAEVPRAIAGA